MKYTGRLIGLLLTLVYSILVIFLLNSINIQVLLFSTVTGVLFWFLGWNYDRIKFQSDKDYLTKVYNRRFVYKEFPKVKRQLAKEKEKLTLLLIDLNKFKKLNDTYGHEEGDKALQNIAKILTSSTRNTDLVARWGGDEFVIIAPNTDHNAALHIKKRIEEQLEQDEKYLGVSIGCATYPDDSKSLHELLQVADEKMYKAKHNMVNVGEM